MMNLNPAMYWWQWMLDQLDEGEEGEGIPRMGLRLSVAGQLAALKSYRQMLKAAQASGSVNQVTDAIKKLADEMWAAGQREQPSAIEAQLSMMDTLIQKLEEEQAKAKDKEGYEKK
jgi:hypothetical protein